VCLFTAYVGSGSSPLSCGVFLPLLLLQAFPLLIPGRVLVLLPVLCLFTAHVGGGSFPLFCGVFLPLPLLQAFPAPGWWARAPSARASLALPGLFIYSFPGRIPLLPSLELRAPHPLCYLSLLFLLLISQFLFFPCVRFILSRGLC
jgi:hypothetical protein